MRLARKGPQPIFIFVGVILLFAASAYKAFLLEVAHPIELLLFVVILVVAPLEYGHRLSRPHLRTSSLLSIFFAVLMFLVLGTSVLSWVCSRSPGEHIPVSIAAALMPAVFPLGIIA